MYKLQCTTMCEPRCDNVGGLAWNQIPSATRLHLASLCSMEGFGFNKSEGESASCKRQSCLCCLIRLFSFDPLFIAVKVSQAQTSLLSQVHVQSTFGHFPLTSLIPYPFNIPVYHPIPTALVLPNFLPFCQL